jgi:hypothetical protein
LELVCWQWRYFVQHCMAGNKARAVFLWRAVCCKIALKASRPAPLLFLLRLLANACLSRLATVLFPLELHKEPVQ